MTRTRLPFTTILIAVAITNFATLVIMNLLDLSVRLTAPIYLVCAIGAWLLANRVQWRRLSIKIDRISVGLAVIILILLTIPRLTYVSEWIPGNTVAVIGDDFRRLGLLASMTLSDAYPLRHLCNGHYLLSYYYASFYPWVVVKLLVPWVTLKDTIFLGNLFYQALLLGSLVELAHLLMRNTASVRILLFFTMVFGGFDWTVAGTLLTDCEWWQARLFHADTQITAFYTAQLIVIHHFLSFYLMLLAYVVFFYSRIAGSRRLKAWIVLLLCALGILRQSLCGPVRTFFGGDSLPRHLAETGSELGHADRGSGFLVGRCRCFVEDSPFIRSTLATFGSPQRGITSSTGCWECRHSSCSCR